MLVNEIQHIQWAGLIPCQENSNPPPEALDIESGDSRVDGDGEF